MALRRGELQLDRWGENVESTEDENEIIRVVLAQDEVNKGTRFSSRHLGMEVMDSNVVCKSLVPLSQGGILDPGSPRSTLPPLEHKSKGFL